MKKFLENHVETGGQEQPRPRSSTSAHTPGPWQAFFSLENERTKIGSWRFVHEETRPVPLVRCTRSNRAAEANARLIAAAPDMLEVLREVETYLDDRADVDDGKPNTEMSLLVEVRAILTKAEGKAS